VGNREGSHAFIIIIKIFTNVDDTVQIHKNILNDLNKHLDVVGENPHFAEMYLSIFDPKTDYLEKHGFKKSEFSTSKKDTEVRRKELVQYCLASLTNYFSFDLRKNLIDNNRCKLVGCLIREILSGEDDTHHDFVTSVITKIITDFKEHAKKKSSEGEALISHSTTHRLIKSFVIDFANSSGKAKDFYQLKIDELYELIFRELAVLINTKAIFIIIAFIEFTDYKDQIISELARMKHLLKKSGNENTTGMKILMKHMESA